MRWNHEFADDPHPIFGPRAPDDLRLKLRLSEARIGARSLPLRAPSVARDGDRVVLDHGGVREVWRLVVDHAEPDFVVDAAGATEDLVVRVAVETGLDAPQHDAAGGLRFCSTEFGGVDYSEAVIVDGDGKRLTRPVEFELGAIVLSAPASFLRDAHGLITIDPIIRVVTVDGSALTQRTCDVAYVATTGVWLVAYEELVSLSDADIIARRFDADGSFLDEVAVEISSDSALFPAVAANRSNPVRWRRSSSDSRSHR